MNCGICSSTEVDEKTTGYGNAISAVLNDLKGIKVVSYRFGIAKLD